MRVEVHRTKDAVRVVRDARRGAARRPPLPRRPGKAIGMRRHTFAIPVAMDMRILVVSLAAGRSLGLKIPLAAVFRAALLLWIDRAEGSSQRDTCEEIRRTEPLYGTLLQRSQVALSSELSARLDKLREKLGGPLFERAEEGRSALLLAALTPWLKAAESDLHAVLEGLRASVVKRGRKQAQ